MGTAEQGDILVIDNGGRLDEGCIGELTVLEAQASGLADIIVWGAHRDLLLCSGFESTVEGFLLRCGKVRALSRVAH